MRLSAVLLAVCSAGGGCGGSKNAITTMDGGIVSDTCPTSAVGTVPSLPAGTTLVREDVTVNGIYADRYAWRDAEGRVRSVSLKKQCSSNTGNGGYAVQMTYQLADGTTRILSTDDGSDGGFGYFVSHEASRSFDDGTTGAIGDLHGEDSSELGKELPVVGTAAVNGTTATHTFVQHYFRWGTAQPVAYDDVNNVIPAPAALSAHVRYDLPVTISWHFAAGSDDPMIRIAVDQSAIPGADHVYFDVRGPYGVLPFDEGKGTAVQGLFWGDRFFRLSSLAVPLTWNSGADWSVPNDSARYEALVAGDYEMGLYEPRPIASTALADGYASNRGLPAAMVDCDGEKLPCQGEWPYQSLNYSLDPSTPDEPTTGMKIAWGSAAFYGSSLTTISAGNNLSEPFNGRPAGGLVYDTCVLVDRPLAAQGADGASTIKSTTQAVSALDQNRAAGGRCAVP